MKKNISVIVLLAAILFTFTACNNAEEEIFEPMISLRKLGYASAFRFDFRIIIKEEHFVPWFDEPYPQSAIVGALIDPRLDTFTDFYTELVFVHSEEESLHFPDNVIVAWPRERTVQGIINGLHWRVLRNELDLADFGLSYPITATNLVEDWEKVFALDSYINLNTIAQEAIEFGNEAWLVVLEVAQLGGSEEAGWEVFRAVRELNMTQTEGVALLRAAGSFDAFFDAANRMRDEGLTVEQILAELESAAFEAVEAEAAEGAEAEEADLIED